MDHLQQSITEVSAKWNVKTLGLIQPNVDDWQWSTIYADGQFAHFTPLAIYPSFFKSWEEKTLSSSRELLISKQKTQLLCPSPSVQEAWLFIEFIEPLLNIKNWYSEHAHILNFMSSALIQLGERISSQSYFQSILDNSPDVISIKDLQGNFILVNHTFEVALGRNIQQVIGHNIFEVFPKEVANRIWQKDLQAINTNRTITSDEAIIHADRTEHTYLTVKFPVTFQNDIFGTCTIGTDITEHIEFENKLKDSESRLKIIIENMPTAIVMLDASTGLFSEVNRSAEVLFGLSRLQLTRLRPSDVSPQFQANRQGSEYLAKEYVERALKGEGPVFEWNHLHVSGREVPCEIRLTSLPKGGLPAVMGTITDISDRKAAEHALKAEQDRLAYLAYHDALTKLPNRLLLQDRLVQAINRAIREKKQLAVLLIDLDGFKEINDTFGHECGDEVLIQTALRLKNHLRAADTAARLGGDEFVIIIENLEGKSEAKLVAQKLVQSIHDPLMISDHKIQITASIGIAIYPGIQVSGDSLLSDADKAMYYAKESGKNRYQLFEELSPSSNQ